MQVPVAGWFQLGNERAVSCRAFDALALLETERERTSVRHAGRRCVQVPHQALADVVAFANENPARRRINQVDARRFRGLLSNPCISEHVGVAIICVHVSMLSPRTVRHVFRCAQTRG